MGRAGDRRATGSATGDGFKLSNASGGGIDGFTITGGVEAGIAIKSSSNDFTIRNCIIFDNPGAGIRVQDSGGNHGVQQSDLRNGLQGLASVGTSAARPGTRLQ